MTRSCFGHPAIGQVLHCASLPVPHTCPDNSFKILTTRPYSSLPAGCT